MPVVTNPPVLVSLNYVTSFVSRSCFVGPIISGGAMYIMVATIGGGGLIEPAVFKSTNGGASWTLKDGAGVQDTGNFQAALRTAGFDCLSTSDPSEFPNFKTRYQKFDPSTDTWGSVIQSATAEDNPADMVGSALSTGDDVVAYATTAAKIDAFSRLFTSSWQAEQSVDGADIQDVDIGSCALASDDVSHVILVTSDAGAGTNIKVKYVQLDASASPGAVSVAFSVTGASFPVFGRGQVLSGVPMYPYIDFNVTPSAVRVLIGPDGSWTEVDPRGAVDPTLTDLYTFSMIDHNGDFLVFWSTTDFSTVNRLYYARYNGSGFDAAVLFYDQQANPPANASNINIMQVPSFVDISGTIYGLFTMQDNDGVSNAYFLNSGGAANTQRNRFY